MTYGVSGGRIPTRVFEKYPTPGYQEEHHASYSIEDLQLFAELPNSQRNILDR